MYVDKVWIFLVQFFSVLIFLQKLTYFFINGRNFARNTRQIGDNVNIFFDNIVAPTFLHITDQVSLRESEISHSEKSFFSDLSSTNFTPLLSQPRAIERRLTDLRSVFRSWPLAKYVLYVIGYIYCILYYNYIR